MLAQQPVRVPHVARVQPLAAQDLRNMEGTLAFAPNANVLSSLLMGTPLSARESPPNNDALAAALDEALARAMHTLGQSVEGVGEPLTQAQLEWARVAGLPSDFGGIAARRACLLFALHREPETRAWFAAREPGLVADLTSRVLPVTTPPFISGMAQSPDAYVVLTTMLLELFPGEALGGAPAAYVEEAVGVLRDGGDREGACASA